MNLLLILSPQDAALANPSSFPVEVAVLADGTNDLVSERGPLSYSAHELVTRCIGAAASTAAGMKSIEKFLSGIAEATGTAPLARCNLTHTKIEARESALRRFVTDSLASILESQVRRSAELSRSLAALRQTHGQMQSAFAKLEKFVFDNNLAQRTESLALLPGRDLAPLEIREGETLVQRLPISSVGLSDLGLFIDGAEIADQGTLAITLVTKEDDAVRGCWTLSGPRLRPGPVRLALRMSLGTSALTPVLEIGWTGEGAIRLSASLCHPDPRLQARIGEQTDPRVLALRCWTYLPGSEAPVPASAHLPEDQDARPPRFRVVDGLMLLHAEDLTPESQYSQYLADKEALIVHPMPEGVSAMRVPAGAPSGTTHVDARICTVSDQAKPIEYAMGIVPPGWGGITRQKAEPEGLVGMTQWVQLGPQQDGQLHLPLKDALPDDHDLLLMTRMAEQPGDTKWGWATFSRIRIAAA